MPRRWRGAVTRTEPLEFLPVVADGRGGADGLGELGLDGGDRVGAGTAG